jgi:hypothetical protein
MPTTMQEWGRPPTRPRIAPKDPTCLTCRRTCHRRFQALLAEMMQQLTRCRRCGDYYLHHRVTHPHLLVSQAGEVQCDGWRESEEDGTMAEGRAPRWATNRYIIFRRRRPVFATNDVQALVVWLWGRDLRDHYTVFDYDTAYPVDNPNLYEWMQRLEETPDV